MRSAVVDLGTNSTRLLVADLAPGHLDEVERRTAVTSLGRGVGLTGTICADAIEEVCGAVAEFKGRYEQLGAERVVAIATSAVRDARNGDAFIAELRERFGIDARLLSGEEEALLTYMGATAGRPPKEGTLVFDIGGGSTELVFGRGEQVEFHASLQAGTIRHSERHLAADPPGAAALEELADDVRHTIERSLDGGPRPDRGIAVAGTPISLAAVDQELEPYRSERVHGYHLGLGAAQRMLSRLAALPLAERLRVKGLHPRRAPTIVAGTVILVQVMRAFGLEEVEVSENDILHGAGLSLAQAPA